MEILAIAKHFLLDVEQHVKFSTVVGKAKNLNPEHKLILKMINDMYELFPEKNSITIEELRLYFGHKYGAHKTKQLILDTITSIERFNVGPEITKSILEKMLEQDVAARIAGLAAPVLANQSFGKMTNILDEVEEYFDTVESIGRDDPLIECNEDWAKALKIVVNDSGIAWPLDVLNKCVGGVAPGLGLAFARPDVGKTSFALNCAAKWAFQLRKTDNCILYCGNEEGILKVRNRFGTSLAGCTLQWAEQNPAKFKDLVVKWGGDKCHFHGGIRSTRDVETLIKRYKPTILIADQLPKFVRPGRATDKDVQRLADLYGWFRDKSGEYGIMTLGLAQCDVQGNNKLWIGLDNINASKTDVPGELDFAIGIGMQDEPGMEKVRGINVCKNKLKYGRKGRDQVIFDNETCRYEEKPNGQPQAGQQGTTALPPPNPTP